MQYERIFLDKFFNHVGSWLGDAYCHLLSNCTMGLFDRGGFVCAHRINSRVFNLDGFSMSEMSKQKALNWLVSNVKQWPAADSDARPQNPAKTSWHYDLETKSWQLFVIMRADDLVYISQGDWAIEKGRIAAEKRQVINARFEKKMKDKDYFRWNGYIPNKLEAKAQMSNLAAKLRGENDDRFNN